MTITKKTKISFPNPNLDLDIIKYSMGFEVMPYVDSVEITDTHTIFTVDDAISTELLWDIYEEYEGYNGDFSSLAGVIAKNKFIEISQWVKDELDRIAMTFGYDDIKSCRSYTGFPNQFKDECDILSIWASDVWVRGFEIQQEIINGVRDFPTQEEILVLMPACPLGEGPM